MHLIELHKELQKAQGKFETDTRVKAYKASARCQQDIATLSRNG